MPRLILLLMQFSATTTNRPVNGKSAQTMSFSTTTSPNSLAAPHHHPAFRRPGSADSSAVDPNILRTVRLFVLLSLRAANSDVTGDDCCALWFWYHFGHGALENASGYRLVRRPCLFRNSLKALAKPVAPIASELASPLHYDKPISVRGNLAGRNWRMGWSDDCGQPIERGAAFRDL